MALSSPNTPSFSQQHHHLLLLLLLHLFLLPPLSFSDPRISQSGLFCSPNKLQTKTFIPTFIKEMETLSQLITTTHFATFQFNSTYGLAQCYHDLSRTDCLLCFAAARTKLPRCLPSSAARIYLDGCFLRYDNYRFYNESTSPEFYSLRCSSEKGSVSAESVVRNVTKIAVEKGGFGVLGASGVYALAQCWESVGVEGCKECLEKAARGLVGCGKKREGRALNAGCYLRYSDHEFYNHDKHTNNNHGNFF